MTDSTDLVIYEDETPTALAQWAEAPQQAWSLADALMGMHPAAKEVGVEGMRTAAQLAILTGANPLPGTNGIHVWRDKDGRICHTFGIGFWRGEADRAGGLLWIIQPRFMTDDERKAYGIQPGVIAAIASAALRSEVFALRAQARQFGDELSFNEAKQEVARVGIGIAAGNEYAKKGRSLGWSATERAERDLLRKLVTIGTGNREPVNRGWSPGLLTGPQPSSTLTGANGGPYTLDDANADFGFVTAPVATVADEPEEGNYEDENPPTRAVQSEPEPVYDAPLPDDELVISEATAREFLSAAASCLETDEATVKERLAALGYDRIPGDKGKRLNAYRQLKAAMGTTDGELFDQPALVAADETAGNGAYNE